MNINLYINIYILYIHVLYIYLYEYKFIYKYIYTIYIYMYVFYIYIYISLSSSSQPIYRVKIAAQAVEKCCLWFYTIRIDLSSCQSEVMQKFMIIQAQKQPYKGVLEKGILKICSLQLLCNFIVIVLRHEFSPVNLLHILLYIL